MNKNIECAGMRRAPLALNHNTLESMESVCFPQNEQFQSNLSWIKAKAWTDKQSPNVCKNDQRKVSIAEWIAIVSDSIKHHPYEIRARTDCVSEQAASKGTNTPEMESLIHLGQSNHKGVIEWLDWMSKGPLSKCECQVSKSAAEKITAFKRSKPR